MDQLDKVSCTEVEQRVVDDGVGRLDNRTGYRRQESGNRFEVFVLRVVRRGGRCEDIRVIVPGVVVVHVNSGNYVLIFSPQLSDTILSNDTILDIHCMLNSHGS